MKGDYKKRALLCIAILVFAFNFIAVQNVSADPTISITGNSGFIGYPGSGTPGDPYRIENFTISAALAFGISIRNTDAYFVIKNCTVYDGSPNQIGIYLQNVTHGRIENCTVYNNAQGIFLYINCSNNILASNTACNNYYYGIHLYLSSNNTLTGNTACNNTNAGIHLYDNCNNNTLTGNTAYNNTNEGIRLDTNCNNNTLTGNTVYNNTAGIDIYSLCNNNNLSSNIAYNNTNNGIYLGFNSNNNTFTGNIACNSTYYGIYLDSSSNNTLISNTACNNTYYGIYLALFDNNNTLTNNTACNSIHGILLYSSSNNTLTNNKVYNNSGDGIALYYNSYHNNLTRNTVYNNSKGIVIASSSTNTLTGNTVCNNIHGIFLVRYISPPSTGTQIHYCNIYNNTQYGIYNNETDPPFEVYATFCYWGSPDGPSGAGSGHGDTISLNVFYDPWLMSPYPHDPILIDGNSQFKFENGVVSGSGSEVDPYVLADLAINASAAIGIDIANTDAYFIIRNCTVYDGDLQNNGIVLSNVIHGIVENCTVYNNMHGIYLINNCTNNTLNDNYAHNNAWDFYSDGTCTGNVANNLHIYCYPVNISFTYDNGIAIVGVPLGSTPPDPSNQANLSMYVNVTNVTPLSWVLLNVSYADSDVVGLNESSLRLYRWNGTAWELADSSGVNGVDTLNNYIYANVTEFSIFGPFGTPLETAPQPKPVGGFVLPAEAPAYAAMLIIVTIAVGAASAAFARKRLP